MLRFIGVYQANHGDRESAGGSLFPLSPPPAGNVKIRRAILDVFVCFCLHKLISCFSNKVQNLFMKVQEPHGSSEFRIVRQVSLFELSLDPVDVAVRVQSRSRIFGWSMPSSKVKISFAGRVSHLYREHDESFQWLQRGIPF